MRFDCNCKNEVEFEKMLDGIHDAKEGYFR